jgi:hypothetical protein
MEEKSNLYKALVGKFKINAPGFTQPVPEDFWGLRSSTSHNPIGLHGLL